MIIKSQKGKSQIRGRETARGGERLQLTHE